jgi:hypothetical protein
MPMQHRIRTLMSIPTREATTVPFRVRGMDTEDRTGAVLLGAATEALPHHSGHTDPALHQGLPRGRVHRSRRSFEKGVNE